MVVERCIINRLAVSAHNCARSSLVSIRRECPEATELSCIEIELRPTKSFFFCVASCQFSRCRLTYLRAYSKVKNSRVMSEGIYIIYIIVNKILLRYVASTFFTPFINIFL